MSWNDKLTQAKSKISSWFFWFWVRQWRTTILVLVLFILIGTFSAYRIPKESFPEVNLGMVTIMTVYPGWNPEDIDSLITKKIEDQIQSIDGIDSIDSTSANNISTVMATLENDADVDSVANKIQDAVNKVNLPSDANDPVISQIDTNTIGKMMFNMVLYAKDDRFSEDYLKEKAIKLKKTLEWVGKIDTISLSDWSVSIMWWWNDWEIYDIDVLIDQDRLNQLWLTIPQISNILQWFNVSQPLGSHKIWDKKYAFRIDWEITSLEQLSQTPIPLQNWKTIPLETIATIKTSFDGDSQINVWHVDWETRYAGNLAVELSFNRKGSASVFAASNDAKKRIEKEFESEEYKDLWYFFTSDLGKKVSDLYNELVVNMISTLLVVFLIVLCFVWSLESFLATISIPIAFFVTFFVLNALWYTMNVLTNFSLIICLWIAVDSATVIIQWASENMKKGYKPLHAAMLSVRTYKNSLISWTATTVVVFIPLMMLPWVMWKAMSLIPITIFTTLLASLFVSLTITPTIFFLVSKDKKKYTKNPESEQYLLEDEKLLLENDRINKIEKKDSNEDSFRDRVLDKLVERYEKLVDWVLDSTVKRALWIIVPIVIFLLTSMFISTKLWFLLMPNYDSEDLSVTLTADAGFTTKKMIEKSEGLHEAIIKIPELENYTEVINWNTISISIALTDHKTRKRTSFDVEADLTRDLAYLKERWFDVAVQSLTSSSSSMWSAGEIWIKIKADEKASLDDLNKVARDFENYLKTLPWTKNITNSSKESPWQFVFTLDEDRLAMLWLTKTSVGPSLYLALNWMDAGSVKIDWDSHDISLKYNDFEDTVSPDTLMWTIITTTAWQIPLASIASYTFKPAVSNITREDWDIVVNIWANLEQDVKAESVNEPLYAYWESYDFPDGISYSKWWEQVENADLIESLLASIAFAFIMIFGILVLQFNSYVQPLIISYSLLMWFVWATYWMLVTWNPYSMMFLIWFVALMGIVVNNAIILIDSANDNVSHWYSRWDAIKESAKSRLKPILSTTLTTVIGMWTLLTNGMFALLAYTIMFGLSFATFVTLFAIPVLYKDEGKLRLLIRRLLFKPWLILVFPIIVIGILFLLAYMFWFDLMWTIWWNAIMWSLMVTTALFLIFWEFTRNCKWEAWWRQNILKIGVRWENWKKINTKQVIKRIMYKFIIFLAPIVITVIIVAGFKLFWANEEMVALAEKTALFTWYLFWAIGNIYCFWVTDGNQFIHDKLTWFEILDLSKNDEN